MTAAFVPQKSPFPRSLPINEGRKHAQSLFVMRPLSDPGVTSSLQLAQDVSSFEPVLPDTTALVGMGSVLVLCIIAGYVWANQVVPVSRTKLAISKNRGEVKEYLDELREGMPTNASTVGDTFILNATAPITDDGRAFERWLFTDWLERSPQPKEPALPMLKKAKWNSGDNPVLVTAAIMGIGVLVASVTERATFLIQQ